MAKHLHLFDLDGTLTPKDTLFHFFRTTYPEKYPVNFALHLPYFLFLKAKLLNPQQVKEKFIGSFIKNQSQNTVAQKAQAYAKKFPAVMYPAAFNKIAQLKQNTDNEIYIVSASTEIWVKSIADFLNIGHICTQMEIRDNIYTGKIKGRNCNGIEKKLRITEAIDLSDYQYITAYGDSKGDYEMFTLAHNSYMKPFR